MSVAPRARPGPNREDPDIRRYLLSVLGAALVCAGPALAQSIQIDSYANDVTLTSGWQDLTATYPAMANAPSWIANKSNTPVLVVFSSSATAPAGGGIVLAGNAGAMYGNAGHVWARSLDARSVVSIGLAAAQASGGSGSGSTSSLAATASATAPTYSAGSQPLSMDLFGSLRSRVENGANVALGATYDSAWTSGQGSVVALLKTIAAAALDNTTVSTVGIDGSSPGVTNVIAGTAQVATADGAFANGTWQPLAINAAGRLKVVDATATNVVPAAATPSAASLGACQYTAAGVTFQNGWTGALQCDSGGRLSVAAAQPTSATSVSTNVTAATASTQLLAANANRMGGNIVNDSTAVMYLKLSTAASATSYDYFLSGSVNGVPAQFEIPAGWTGPVTAAWASATGAARVSERTR